METFCRDQTALNCRQACAVESAAKMNPEMTVYLLFFGSSHTSKRTSQLIDTLLSHYSNVRVNRVFLLDYIKDTPLEHWLTEDVLKSSNWPLIHTSDIMRLLTLWKFGGIYLDLDVVVTAYAFHNPNYLYAFSNSSTIKKKKMFS